MSRRPTLRQIFALSLLGLLVGLGAIFYLMVHGSGQAMLNVSERYRELASGEVATRVTNYLDEAPHAVADFESQIHDGLVDPRDLKSVEHGLISLLLANPNLSEATLTFSRNNGTDEDVKIDVPASGQVAVLRDNKAFVIRFTWYNDSTKQFMAVSGPMPMDGKPPGAPVGQAAPVADPTQHLTFQTSVSHDFYGQLIATDLHWSQIDENLPENQRRVELSVQKSVKDAHGAFAGVVRIGLLKDKIDAAVQQKITGRDKADPHLIFICDDQGRLITGFGERDKVVESGDDLRIAPADVPPVVARAVRDKCLSEINDKNPVAACTFEFEGKTYLCTFRSLPGTQDWIVGVLVPLDFYLGPLVQIRNQVLIAALVLIAVLLAAFGFVLQVISRAQGLVVRETEKMNRFDFAPSAAGSAFGDVEEVLGGMERAKTAMRAMSKYVPVNLVRRLYRDGREPVLGGRTSEITVMFTDIRDFTSYAEQVKPDELARRLGLYLEVMARVIQEDQGTIDKYIGDAVMVFWNAPEPVPNHETRACHTALRCLAALRALYDSPQWGVDMRFETRFGVNKCEASVGHFGAPDRFNYTAIGDGVNLASRLEGLNKFYGTTIIVSEDVHAAAREHFDFRLLDCVEVKGKMKGVTIYELLGERDAARPRPTAIERYEQAFALYQNSKFAEAAEILKMQKVDPPSASLLSCCRRYVEHPPVNWDGTRHFDVK